MPIAKMATQDTDATAKSKSMVGLVRAAPLRKSEVKAFNTVFAPNQSIGKIGNEQLTAFIAGDDLKAKQTVAQLTRDIGFDPVDCGPLKAARYLEAMGVLINLAYNYGMGTKIGYKLVKA
jgi:8-hydroxy-5-deazaflavin:NADPH oxidoreductase